MNGRIRVLLWALVSLLIAAVVSSRSAGQYKANTGADITQVSSGRVLRFPQDQSIGVVYVQEQDFVIPDTVKGFHPGHAYAAREYLCPAKGEVRVPAGKRVLLIVRGAGATRQRCQAALGSLGPNDLYELVFWPPIHIDDDLMPYVARLTGLRDLRMGYARVTPKGLAWLAELTQLEHLSTPDGISDTGMAEVAKVQSLKVLDATPNRMTNKGLASLVKLRSLAVLHLDGSRTMSDDGLRALRDLSSLRHLRLSGPFTDRAMEHLAAMPSLRVLWLDTLNVSDEGLQRLSKSRSLERLCMHWLEKITDRGITYLKNMPQLRALDVNHAALTDAALARLATMSSLDYLYLPNFGITDVGIAHLGRLQDLTYLWVNCSAAQSPLTDNALRTICQWHDIEELHIGGTGFTDEGIGQLASLKKLQVLAISWPDLDNDNLKQLARLPKLRKLSWGWYNEVSMSGLSALNELTPLETLDADQVRQDDGGLDLSGLKNLTTLRMKICVQAKIGGEYVRRHDTYQDGDLACLSGLTKLDWLSLDGPGIGNDGLGYLAGLTNLEILSIGGSAGLTDDGLRHLANMRKLRSLGIGDGQITARGLSHLYSLKSLDSIRIKSAVPISRHAVARLRSELPHLRTLQISQPEPAGRARSPRSRARQ